MVPPGRRRGALLPLLLGLFVLFASTASAASAVLGVDLGTSYLKGALVKPGIPLEIVLSKDSKRKETAAVAFKSPRNPYPASGSSFPERAYGGDALALAARFPADVYPNLKPLLGQRLGGNAAEEYLQWHPALEAVSLEGRDTVGFKSPSFEKDAPAFSIEELLAMELQNLRENAETLAGKGTRISEAVITVPAFFTGAEKRAVELAAQLAGLNVLALVSDGLAVGLNYATSRTFPSINEGGKPEHHMVFDMGAGSTTATIIRFQGRTVKDVGRFNKTVQEVMVLGTGWDKSLGGDALNGLVMNHIIEQFADSSEAKSGNVKAADVKKHGRTTARLWKDAEKVRQVLSANQATGTGFESLYQDIDFKYKITRAEFETMAAEHAERVAGPVQQALSAAGLTFADLDSVILHGGAVRTPFVQKKLESLVGDPAKLRSNVNADEAAVFGAAFKGAGLSPSFRVKEIRASDAANYPVGLHYSAANGKEHNQKLFAPTSKVGTVKEVPFKMLSDFDFSMYQTTEEGVDQPLFSVKTSNLTQAVSDLVEKEGCNRDDISTKLSIRLDPIFGLPEVTKAEVSCEVEGDKKGGVAEGVKNLFGFGSKKGGDQEPLKDGEKSAEESTETVESKASSASSAASSASESASTEKAEDAKPSKNTVTGFVGFTVSREGYETVPKTEMKRMKDRLTAFDASDRARFNREAALNALEAFTYRARDLLSDEGFISASTEAHRADLQSKLEVTSEWLYGDGTDADEATLKTKLSDLTALVDPVVKRRDEAVKRPEQVKMLKDALNQTKNMITMLKNDVEKAAEASSSAAAASASSASVSPSSTPAASSESAADPLDDLEEDATSTASSESAKETEAPYESPYSAADVEELDKAYTEVNAWLEERLTEQEKRRATEDAALSSVDLETKARKLNDVAMELLQRKIMRGPKKSGSSSGGKSGKKAKKDTKKKAEKKKAEKTEKGEKEEKAKADKDSKTPDHEEL